MPDDIDALVRQLLAANLDETRRLVEAHSEELLDPAVDTQATSDRLTSSQGKANWDLGFQAEVRRVTSWAFASIAPHVI